MDINSLIKPSARESFFYIEIENCLKTIIIVNQS